MSALGFTGLKPFIEQLDRAVNQPNDEAVTEAVRQLLCRSIRQRDIELPEEVYQRDADSYARRLLYQSPEYGYSVVAMTWGPEQGTPVHDHSGMWCVEGVWAGFIEVTQYELMETDGDRFRFESRGCIEAGKGSAGSLIPPHEYHTIRNPHSDETAISIHIYSGEMVHCNKFRPLGNGWYGRQGCDLKLSA